MRSIKDRLSRHHNNYRGWRTSRKIIVIESDDWGSVCMPSPEIKQKLLHENYRIDKCPYAAYDSLASAEDLERLFSMLSEYRDKNGRHPVITANTVMTNPDFQKIRESGFTEYHYELCTDTLKKYPSHEYSFQNWKQGMNEGLFFPQFHGREHVNIKEWMKALRNTNSPYRAVFDDEVSWLGSYYDNGNGISLRAAYDTRRAEDIEHQKTIIKEGLELFETLFGYRSGSFIANNFICHPGLNQTLFENGVRYIQGMKYQKLPILGEKKRGMVRRYQGERNEMGQYCLVRNCVFEPSQFPDGHNNVEECLKGMRNAFFWRKPAVISSHRLNFIGYIDPGNRDKNLKQFRELLKLILKKWPNAEFMTSVDLGNLIEAENPSE